MDKGFTVITDIELKELKRKAKFYDTIEKVASDLFYDDDEEIGDVQEVDDDGVDVLSEIGEQVCLSLGYYG